MVIDPYNKYVAVTPSDTVNLPNGPCEALYVGVAGVVVAVTESGTAVTFTGAPVGILPIRAKRVNSTSTTATNIVALYRT